VHSRACVMDAEEADASAVIEEALRADGIDLELNARAVSVRHENGVFRLALAGGKTLEAEALLIATGRTPNTKELAVERSGIALTSRGYVKVDDYLQTTCPGVYALGDVAGQPAFTHVSWEDFRRLRSTFAGTPRRRDDRVLSYSTFTEPQLARTGLTLAEALAKGIDARAHTLPLSDVARGTEWNLERGFFRLVVGPGDEIVGATFVGYEAGEIIHTVAFGMERGATWRDLDAFMGIHPTFGEGLPSLARLFEEDAPVRA